MKISIRLLFVMMVFITAASCKKSNKLGIQIPKNAAVAIIIDGKSVFSKLPWADIKQNEWFKDCYQDTAMNEYIRSVLDNPENSGINYQSDVLFYLQKDSLGGYMVLKGNIKDKDKWKTFNNKLFSSTPSTTGTDYIMNDKVMVVTKDDRFAIVVDVPQINRMNGRYSLPGVYAKRDLKPMADNVLSMDKKNTLSDDKHFNELMESRGDVAFWMNVEEANKGNLGMAALSMMNFSKLFQGSILTAGITFNEGKINADFTSYAGKEMTELYKKYSGTSVDKEMIKRIPSQNLAALFAFNFKPEGLREFMKLAGLESLITIATAKVGFTFDDFIKAMKGDILFTVSDMVKDSNGRLKPNFLFSSSINDRPSFNKLIDAGNQLGKEMHIGTETGIAYNTNDKYFAIGNNKKFIDNYISGTIASDHAFMKEISGSPMAGFMDIHYMLGSMESNYMDSLEKNMLNASLNMWDKVLLNGGEFNSGAIKQHIEVRLIDKTTNSLKQLNNYIGIMGAAQKKRNKMRAVDSEVPVLDSATLAPAEQH